MFSLLVRQAKGDEEEFYKSMKFLFCKY